MPRCYQTIYQRFFLSAYLYFQRRVVVFQLCQGTWPGNDGADMAVGKHPGGGEMRQLDAALLAMRLQGLRNLQRLFPELGFHHALVVAPRTRVGGWGAPRLILAGQYAACDGAIGHDPDAVMGAGRKDFHLGSTVKQVVVRLANNGLRYIQLLA